MDLRVESIAELIKAFDSSVELGSLQNGCGPQYFGWLVPEIDKDACNIHDLFYSLQPNAAEKKLADTWLTAKFRRKGATVASITKFLLRNTNFAKKRYRQLARLTTSQIVAIKWNILNSMRKELMSN